MEKIWLKSYPPGVPAEINPDAYESIVEVLDRSFTRFAKNPAFYNLGVTLTYSEIDRYSREFAAYLQQELKLQKGDRVAIMLPNILQYPVVMFGALRAGLVVVNINPLYTADELVFQLNNSGAETIIALANFAATVQKAMPRVAALKNIIVTNVGDLFPALKGFVTNFVIKYIYRIPNGIFLKQYHLSMRWQSEERMCLNRWRFIEKIRHFCSTQAVQRVFQKGLY